MRARLGNNIDGVAGFVGFDHLDQLIEQALTRLARGPCGVRCDDQVRDGWIEERVAVIWWLFGENIHACACDLFGFEGLGEIRFVCDAAARGVDKERGFLHGLKLRRGDEVFGICGKRAMQGDDIGAGDNVFEFCAALADFTEAFMIGNEDIHVESFGNCFHLRAQIAIADDAQRLASQLVDGVIEETKVTRLLPAACFDIAVIFVDAGAQRKDESKDMLRHARRGISAHIAHGNACVLCGGGVDVVIPGCARDDEFEVGARGDDILVDDDFVGEHDFGALHALYDLRTVGVGVVMEGEIFGRGLQIGDVQAFGIIGSEIEEYGFYNKNPYILRCRHILRI